MNGLNLERGRGLGWLRWAGWGTAVALILAPLVAMKVAPDSGVHWTLSDFVLAAILFGTVGLVLELAIRANDSWSARFGTILAVGTGFLLIWGNLAVGYIGDGDAPINMVFLALPLVALVAGIVARCRPRPTSRILAVTAAVHALTAVIAFPQDTRTGPIGIVFVGLWLASSALFRNAAKEDR